MQIWNGEYFTKYLPRNMLIQQTFIFVLCFYGENPILNDGLIRVLSGLLKMLSDQSKASLQEPKNISSPENLSSPSQLNFSLLLDMAGLHSQHLTYGNIFFLSK